MRDDELCFLSACSAAAAIRNKQLSPVEYVRAVVERIGRFEPQLNACSVLLQEQALETARCAEKAVMRGDPLGPLHGVPVTVKDSLAVRGLPTALGTCVPPPSIAAQDAPSVARLRSAGAIFVAKTTLSENTWGLMSRNPVNGVTHNPWRHGYNAGASSAGAAVGAAAGYGPLHIGSDGGGSIRIPAHFCGVFGFKPTYGRVPMHPVGFADLTASLGPITRTVADAALMLRVIAGPDARDHTCIGEPPEEYLQTLQDPLAQPRIAFSADLGHARVDADVAALVVDAVRAIDCELGCRIDSVDPKWPGNAREIVKRFLAAHMAYLFVPGSEQSLDPALLACVEEGLTLTSRDYLAARVRKYELCSTIGSFFERYDFLLTPTCSVAAFPADRVQPSHWPQHAWDFFAWSEFSYPFNFAGNPAASVPCGFTADGLPVGLQIVGRRFDDAGVLKLAATFERIRPWSQQRPPLV